MKIWLIIVVILLTGRMAFAQVENSNPTQSMIIENYFVDSIKVYSIKNDTLKKTYQYDEKGRRILDQTEIWNNEQWEGKERISFTYDDVGNLTYSLVEFWDGELWVGKVKNTWIYKSKGKPVNYLYEIFKDTEWLENKRTLWSYSSSDKIVSVTYDMMINGEWKTSVREVLTYDNSGRELMYLKEHYYDYEWLKIVSNIHSYYPSGKMIFERLENWEWSSETDLGPYQHNLTIDSFDTRGNKLYYIEIKKGEYNNSHFKQTWSYDVNNNLLSYLYERGQGKDFNFVKEFRYSFSYDSNNRKISEIYDEGNNNEWIPQYKWSRTYNSVGDTLTKQFDNCLKGEWISNNKRTWNYDDSSNKISELYEIWENNKWNNKERTLGFYTYNPKKLLELKEIWESDRWVSSVRTTWSHDSLDLLIDKTIEQWKNNSWLKFQVHKWVYDSVGHNTLYTIEEDPPGTGWKIVYQETRNYESNESGTYLSRIYSEIWFEEISEYIPDKLYSWSYNNKGKMLSKWYSYYTPPQTEYPGEDGYWTDNQEIWDYDYNGYLIKHKNKFANKIVFSYNYLYDPLGNLLMISSDDGSSNWIERKLEFKDKLGFSYSFDCYKMEIFYTKITDVEDELVVPVNDVLIFPNPVEHDCNIKLSADSHKKIAIQIYNLLGEKLYSFETQINEGENIIPIRTSILSSGLYNIVISYPDKLKRGMFVKE